MTLLSNCHRNATIRRESDHVRRGFPDPAETTDRRSPNPSRPSRLRVGLLLPVWWLGGVERYHVALARWTTDTFEWVGCAFTAGAFLRQSSIDALAALMPVHADRHSGTDIWWNVNRHETEQQAIDAVLSQCDVLITWGVQSLDTRLNGFRGRVVVLSHGDGQWTRGWLREAARRATDCVAVSREAAGAFESPTVTILPGGVELDRLAPTQSRHMTRRAWGVDSSQTAVGFVGRFSPEKNPLMVARIVGQLGPGYVAIYHGHNPWGEPEFRAEATRLAQGRIVFAGPEWHTGDVYRGLDCLVQASEAEGGPLVAMEAWITGVTLVTTDVGIVRDDRQLAGFSLIMARGAGLDAWCAAVRTVDRQPKGAGRAEAMERYSAAAMARRWENFLDASASGPGSSLRSTAKIRSQLPGLLQELDVKRLLDLPCGDLHWISRMDLRDIEYIGADLSAEQIEKNRHQFPRRHFECLDLVNSRLPRADAVLCRDCLVHLPHQSVKRAIANIITSGATWLISTHFPGRQNRDLQDGTWQQVWRPLDLTADPFRLPEPRHVINEGCTWGNGEFKDKSLAVWRVSDIAAAWE